MVRPQQNMPANSSLMASPDQYPQGEGTIGMVKEPTGLKDVFDEHFGPSTEPVRHDKTAVFAISWDKEHTDMDATPEVEDLMNVFKEYGFHVQHHIIQSRGSPQLELFVALGSFVLNFEGETSLIIVYYAGHGWSKNEDPGSFYLLGNTTQAVATGKKQLEKNSVAWHSVDQCFHNTTADVLIIFDCCEAGALRTAYRARQPCFDFLGACDANQVTPSPGENSFTRALIWALQELKDEAGFDTATLERKIRSYKNFASKDRNPVLFGRYGPTQERVYIAPHTAPGQSPRETPAYREQDPHPLEYLDIRFHFNRTQNADTVARFAEELSRFRKESGADLGMRRAEWLGKGSVIEDLARRWKVIWAAKRPASDIGPHSEPGNADVEQALILTASQQLERVSSIPITGNIEVERRPHIWGGNAVLYRSAPWLVVFLTGVLLAMVFEQQLFLSGLKEVLVKIMKKLSLLLDPGATATTTGSDI